MISSPLVPWRVSQASSAHRSGLSFLKASTRVSLSASSFSSTASEMLAKMILEALWVLVAVTLTAEVTSCFTPSSAVKNSDRVFWHRFHRIINIKFVNCLSRILPDCSFARLSAPCPAWAPIVPSQSLSSGSVAAIAPSSPPPRRQSLTAAPPSLARPTWRRFTLGWLLYVMWF